MFPAFRIGRFGTARKNGEPDLLGQLSYHGNHLEIDMKSDRYSHFGMVGEARQRLVGERRMSFYPL